MKKKKQEWKIWNKNAEKYNEKHCLDIGEHLIKWLSPNIDKETWKDLHASHIFFYEFLVLYKWYTKDFIGDMCDKFPSFHELIKKAKNIQEVKLLKYWTANKLNPAMTIFCLKNNHDYRDRIEVDNWSDSLRETLNKIKKKKS